jgi:hypothetical protein
MCIRIHIHVHIKTPLPLEEGLLYKTILSPKGGENYVYTHTHTRNLSRQVIAAD